MVSRNSSKNYLAHSHNSTCDNASDATTVRLDSCSSFDITPRSSAEPENPSADSANSPKPTPRPNRSKPSAAKDRAKPICDECKARARWDRPIYTYPHALKTAERLEYMRTVKYICALITAAIVIIAFAFIWSRRTQTVDRRYYSDIGEPKAVNTTGV
ncbi:hypothetical protein TWF694_000211 [Orbilia ellipsospora]|uniref:Uncharacterized protein n=1 Tax=Orbilia ellipsospora TaxID=2528407 RepID=A0AAV9XNU4_9PEZI